MLNTFASRRKSQIKFVRRSLNTENLSMSCKEEFDAAEKTYGTGLTYSIPTKMEL
jgi:hypothetical protein